MLVSIMVVTRYWVGSDVTVEEVWVSTKALGRAIIDVVYC